MSVTIYHNPRCSKSRQTLNLIKEQEVELEIIEYLKTPPSAQEIKKLLRLLDLRPRDIIRKGEAVYKSLGLDNTDISDNELINAMAANPILIERPIAVSGDKAVIGRPPKNVIDIL